MASLLVVVLLSARFVFEFGWLLARGCAFRVPSVPAFLLRGQAEAAREAAEARESEEAAAAKAAEEAEAAAREEAEAKKARVRLSSAVFLTPGFDHGIHRPNYRSIARRLLF